MPRPLLTAAWDAFRAAAEARRVNPHDPGRAEALLRARRALDEELAAARRRLPYRTRHVGDLRPGRDGGHVHLAVVGEAVSVAGWRRQPGQTLCGAVPGRAAPERPVTCTGCLRLAERHVDAEPDPPELPLG